MRDSYSVLGGNPEFFYDSVMFVQVLCFVFVKKWIAALSGYIQFCWGTADNVPLAKPVVEFSCFSSFVFGKLSMERSALPTTRATSYGMFPALNYNGSVEFLNFFTTKNKCQSHYAGLLVLASDFNQSFIVIDFGCLVASDSDSFLFFFGTWHLSVKLGIFEV